MSEFYSESDRKKIAQQIAEPTNQCRAITEATGLKILDGIYMLIEILLRKDKPDGAEAENPESHIPHLKVVERGGGGYEIYLDNKRIRCVESYKIEPEPLARNVAKLTLELLVKYP